VCRVPEETFDYFGYSVGRCYSTKTGRAYIGTRPSQKKVRGIMERISQNRGRDTLKQGIAEKVRELNALVVGWGRLFPARPGHQSLPRSGAHSRYWLRQWLCAKHQPTGSCHPSLSRRVSLRDARAGTIGTDNAQLPVSESMHGGWSESRDVGNPHVRLDERDLETERQDCHRARSRLYQHLRDLMGRRCLSVNWHGPSRFKA
jgi:hypothetical protein